MFEIFLIKFLMDTMMPPEAANPVLAQAVDAQGSDVYLLRTPPQLVDFQYCIQSDEPKIERVALEYDLDDQGVLTNLKVTKSTDPCYEAAALIAAAGWRALPVFAEGADFDREGLETAIEFQVGILEEEGHSDDE